MPVWLADHSKSLSFFELRWGKLRHHRCLDTPCKTACGRVRALPFEVRLLNRSPTMTRRQSGFTLIEMLIVVVVIGILAAVAIPKFSNAKARSRAAAIRSDLRNLATAQEEYLSEHGEYALDVALLPYTGSEGVVATIQERVVGGWSATTTHRQGDPGTCALYYGTAAPLAPATSEGVIACQSTAPAAVPSP